MFKVPFENSQYNSDSLIHLLNIADVIPFIATLGIHFIFINVIIYREKNPIIVNKGKEKTTWINIVGDKRILICECKLEKK